MSVVDVIRGELALADEWDRIAEGLRRFDASAPQARLLASCAAELRRHATQAQPDWIDLAAVAAWSGWSQRTLRRRCLEEWEPAGQASKDETGRWRIAWNAVATMQRRVTARDLEGRTPQEIAAELHRRAA